MEFLDTEKGAGALFAEETSRLQLPNGGLIQEPPRSACGPGRQDHGQSMALGRSMLPGAGAKIAPTLTVCISEALHG